MSSELNLPMEISMPHRSSWILFTTYLLALAMTSVSVAADKSTSRAVAEQQSSGGAQDFDAILKKYVDGEYFKYKELKGHKQDLARFERFMEWQANADVKSMSRDDQIAFYINA